MQRLLAFTLHATAASIMAWGWLSLTVTAEWIRDLKGGYFVFLTNQGLAIVWSCMVVSLLRDVFPFIAIIRNAKRALLMISIPLAFVISAIYWSLLLFFPALILRQNSSGATAELMILPFKTDLALHLSPLVTILIDFFVFEPKFRGKYARRVAPGVIIVFSIWYAFFTEYCATFNKSFPYPFLTHSPLPARALIYTATGTIALTCFKVLNALHP